MESCGTMMGRCGYSRRRQCAGFLMRAVRSVFGLMLIGVLTAYLFKNHYSDLGVGSCRNLQRELAALRAECMRGRSQQRTCQLKAPGTGCSEVDEEGIRAIIRSEIQSTYGYDRTSMADFALENLGGCVLSTRDTKSFVVSDGSYYGLFKKTSDPNEILRPSMTPGSCWAFEGHSGTVVIRLLASVFIEGVSIEHVSPLLTPTGEITSAPKTFHLWGLDRWPDSDSKHKFGTFIYKLDGPMVQTFHVHTPSSKSFSVVEVSFLDNHGNETFTCVYRVRIHGKMDKEKRNRATD